MIAQFKFVTLSTDSPSSGYKRGSVKVTKEPPFRRVSSLHFGHRVIRLNII